MKIKDLPEMEKPYEKLENYGANRLSNAELLAIIIRTGTKNVTSIEVAQKLLLLDNEKRGLSFLKNIPLEELQEVKGLGRVKAIQIKAVFELASRMTMPPKTHRKVITKPEQVAEVLMNEMKDETQEIIKTVILNNQNEVMRIVTNSIGTVNANIVEVRDIFKEPIKSNSPKIIIVHNHPNGDPSPSMSDIRFTRKMKEAGELFGIELIDHIIIGNGKFLSLKRLKKF